MKIYITNNTGARIQRKIRKTIKSACRAAAKKLAPRKSFEISVMLTDNESIAALNLAHRNMDKPTDVLSFPMLEDVELAEHGELLGDIVISLEQAKIQAENYEHSLEREIGFLTVHSMLHLFGFNHEVADDEAEMFSLQDEILNKMRLTRR